MQAPLDPDVTIMCCDSPWTPSANLIIYARRLLEIDWCLWRATPDLDPLMLRTTHNLCKIIVRVVGHFGLVLAVARKSLYKPRGHGLTGFIECTR